MKKLILFLTLMFLASNPAWAATVEVSSTSSNIGIGTTGPVTKLQVVGTVTATAFSGDGSAITGLGAGGWSDGGANVYTSTTTDMVGIGTTSPTTTLEVVKQSTNAPLMISGSATGDGNFLKVTSAGNVGIGTINPVTLLEVGGAATVTTLNTGQGAGELYSMDQNVLTSSTPVFTGANLSAGNTTLGAVLGTVDVGGATALELPNSGTLPATCAVGQIYMDTDATSAQRLYACESSNTWVAQAGNAAATNWTDIADASADTTIALAGYETTLTSSLDAASKSVLTISNTDADLANATAMLTLKSVDTSDVDLTYMQIIDTSAGTPRTIFTIGADGAVSTGISGTGSVDIGAAGVRISDNGDGSITFLGLGNGSDEDLTLNFDDTANTVVVSTSTGVTKVDFGSISVASNSISKSFPLRVENAKINGGFVAQTPTGGDASVGASLDAGDGNWRLLFDATTDEAAVWQLRMPDNYGSAPILKIGYSMNSATSGTVEFEGAIMCVTPGDSADIGTASFSAVAVTSETVAGTAGYPKEVSVTLTDDSCAAGDVVFVYLSKDSNDGTNDTATGDTEVIDAALTYTAL